MRARRTARKLALDVIYEAEIRDILPLDAFRLRGELGWPVPGDSEGEDPDLGEPPQEAIVYARSLVAGVQEHQAAIDELMTRYADRWALERMPLVDRSLLRVAVFELCWGRDIPVAVAINEAVELAKSLSTEDSGRFVNGLLGRIAKESSLHSDSGPEASAGE